MDQGMQQNAALAVQAASARESMAFSGEDLSRQIGRFKVLNNDRPAGALPDITGKAK